jgi:universal stress protein E
MHHFHNLLVGIDLSPTGELTAPSQQAVHSALWLARESSAALTFFSVLPNANSADDPVSGILPALVLQAEESGLSARVRTGVGSTVAEYLRQAHEGQHDLVFIGATQSHGLAADLLGTSTTQMLDECPAPVWLAVPGAEPAPRNILIADNLESSDDALRLGVSLPRTVKSTVHILNVVDYPLDHHWATGDRDEQTVRYHQQVRVTAEQTLRAQLMRLSIPGDGLNLHVVGRTGIPDLEILHFIREHSIDLVVLGRSNRTALMAAWFGHTAERLLPEIPCSVLVVKPAS